jgi:hypothetical protein
MKHAVKHLHFVGIGGQSKLTRPAKLAVNSLRMQPPCHSVWSVQ